MAIPEFGASALGSFGMSLPETMPDETSLSYVILSGEKPLCDNRELDLKYLPDQSGLERFHQINIVI